MFRTFFHPYKNYFLHLICININKAKGKLLKNLLDNLHPFDFDIAAKNNYKNKEVYKLAKESAFGT